MQRVHFIFSRQQFAGYGVVLGTFGFNCAYPADEKVSFINVHDYCELEGEICDSYAHLFMRQLLF